MKLILWIKSVFLLQKARWCHRASARLCSCSLGEDSELFADEALHRLQPRCLTDNTALRVKNTRTAARSCCVSPVEQKEAWRPRHSTRGAEKTIFHQTCEKPNQSCGLPEWSRIRTKSFCQRPWLRGRKTRANSCLRSFLPLPVCL